MIVYGPNFRYLKPSPQPEYKPEKAPSEIDRVSAREAQRKSRKAVVLEEMKKNPAHEKHGTTYGYQCGCRCQKCRKAQSEYTRMRYAARRFDAKEEK